MTTFLLVFIFLGISMFFMALGVVFSNKPIKGSCGGLNKFLGLDCGICENKDKCKKKKQAQQSL